MPVITRIPQGTISGIWGSAYLLKPHAKPRPLKLGDVVQPGDRILTADNGIVRVTNDADAVPPRRTALGDASFDALLADTRRPIDLEPTAAGLTAAGGSGYLEDGLRVDRILEVVSPLDLTTSVGTDGFTEPLAPTADTAAGISDGGLPIDNGPSPAPAPAPGPAPAPAPSPDGLGAANDTATTPEDTPVLIPVLANDNGGATTGLVVTAINGQAITVGQIIPVAGGTVQLQPDGQLLYTPDPNVHGPASFEYTVSDGQGHTAQATANVDVISVNDPPLALPSTASGNEDTPIPVALTGSDVDGTVVAVSVTTLPDPLQGTLYLADGSTPVVAGATLTPAQAASLVFVPAPDFNGSVLVPFTVTDNEGAVSPPAQATVTVLPVADPTLSIADAQANEGAGTMVFTVTLDQPSALPVTVQYTTLDGSATGGLDYTPVTGTLTFAPGTTSQTITVPVLNDAVYEGPETFTVRLSDPVQATIAVPAATGTILDDGTGPGGQDDDRPTVSAISSPTVTEGSPLDFVVTLSNASALPQTLTLGTQPGSATPGTDTSTPWQLSTDGGQTWTDISGSTVTVPVGVTQLVVRVPTVDDAVHELTETFTLTAALPRDAAPVSGLGTILDNDLGFVPTPDRFETAEDQAVDGNVLANDQPFPGQPLQVTGFTLGGTSYAPGDTATVPDVGSLQILADGSFHFVPAPDYHGPVPTATYQVSDGTDTRSSTLDITVTPVNDAPDARDDRPDTVLVEDQAAASRVSGNVIAGGQGNVQDIDVDGDALRVTGVLSGTAQPSEGPALSGPVVVQGRYGQLTLQADGSYEYVLDNALAATQNLAAGETAAEVFTYRITDGQGGTDTATLTLQVQGQADFIPHDPSTTPCVVTGLQGEYYGYNDHAGLSAGRLHADDGLARFGGPNLNAVEDLEFLIQGRQQTVGGAADIVGTSQAANLAAVDASFLSTRVDYGTAVRITHDLGANPAVAAGGLVTQGALHDFLGRDAASLHASSGAATGDAVGRTTGLGTTSDAAARLVGSIFLERGNYDFRVVADDGFRLRIGGQTLLEYDGNQPPTPRVFSNVEIGDALDGVQPFELLYWEQGAESRLRIEYRLSSDTAWQSLSTDTVAMFAPGNGPDVFDHRVQDIVESSTNGQYLIRTGVVLDGDAGANLLAGSEARDVLAGGAGDDELRGLGGADTLEGGAGRDLLVGGAGADILNGGAGNDRLEGGAGDDIYRLDSSAADDADQIVEDAGQGTDTVELGANYLLDVDLATLAGGHIENASITGPNGIGLHGTEGANRLVGGAGDNRIDGAGGDDRIAGGAGHDLLFGGAGRDTFEWHLGDAGTPGQPAQDRIADFQLGGAYTEPNGAVHAFGYSNVEAAGSTGDRLDLRDLLVGEHSSCIEVGGFLNANIGNLLDYLDISVQGQDTVIQISSQGGYTGGTATPAATDQVITLQGLDLWSATGTTVGDEAGLVQRLLKSGTLVVD